MYATISADIVSSTSLSKEAMIELNERLKKCLSTVMKTENKQTATVPCNYRFVAGSTPKLEAVK